MSTTSLLSHFYDTLTSLSTLREIEAVLAWDEEVGMPSAAAPSRARQRAYISGLISRQLRNTRFVETVLELYELRESLSVDNRINVERLTREVTRLKKLPESFIERKIEARSLCLAAWNRARQTGESSPVVPWLSTVVELAREEAQCVALGDTLYDALLDYHEPDARQKDVLPLFARIQQSLIPLLKAKVSCPYYYPLELLGPHSPLYMTVPDQQFLCQILLTNLGFDTSTSRVGTSAHPFQKTLSVSDHRISIRYDPDNFLKSVLLTLHEYGHYLYGIRLPVAHYGTPRGKVLSVGMDESQSRFWENMVGRSRAFSRFLFSLIEVHLPHYASVLSPELLWRGSNVIKPSQIRLDASELSYPLHIVLRTRLESDLINGNLEPSDLSEAWCQGLYELIGVRSKNCNQGWLQDIHWFCGLFGYFPTYIFGTLIAAQLERALKESFTLQGLDFDEEITRGNFASINQWLHDKVWCHGQSFSLNTLVASITGEPLSEQAFLSYLNKKFFA